MLDPVHCRTRQKRLMMRLADRRLDAAVCAWAPHVYYLTGHRTHWLQQSAVIVFADGRVWLTTANQPASNVAADEVVSYEAKWFSTQRQDQPAAVAEQVRQVLRQRRSARVGIDASAVNSQPAMEKSIAIEPIDPDLWQLRRRKDPDELELMRMAMKCSEAMYRRAREIIEPGIGELRVFTELYAAAVAEGGEPLSALLGNDYACNARGGPPRKDHQAAAGELYILDLGPAFRGYFSDSARTFSVDRHPTDQQTNAWQAVVSCHDIVQRMAKPGVRCRDIFSAVDEYLKQARGGGMPHHLGHGVGLQPHEFPHLNPRWDDVLMEGEVFTAEPGQYAKELAAGIRIENEYLVTAGGVQNLLDFPMEL